MLCNILKLQGSPILPIVCAADNISLKWDRSTDWESKWERSTDWYINMTTNVTKIQKPSGKNEGSKQTF